MTDQPLPDLGERPASSTSGYDEGSALPTHVGEPIVKVQALEKYFGDNHVLRGVDLEIRQREAVMIIGRSGSGKTTLLRCINFLEEPTVGSVEIDGLKLEADPLRARSRKHQEQIRQMRLRAGMLFQEFNLFPHMSVLENCIEGPTARPANTTRHGDPASGVLPGGRWPHREAGRVSGAPIGRTEAARGDRASAVHGAEGAAVR